MNTIRSHFNRVVNDQTIDLIIRVVTVTLLLYFFLIGVKSLSGGMKLMGAGFANTLFDMAGHPFVSLMMGMFATVLFQSSSVTTAIIVGLVSAGTLNITGAIPMIMGANLGTSVTNTIVSVGYIREKANFKKAFAAATVHDFFNIFTVAILLPLELMFGFIEKLAVASSSLLYGSISGVKYSSPIKALIGPPTSGIKSLSVSAFGEEVGGIAMMILACFIIIASLSMIVKTMKVIIENNKGEIINKLLSKNAYGSMALGAFITVAVQSSSITTSLLIPMAGSGLLSLHAIYPITIGANIGTTATALLAALTGNIAGLSIALVHLFFNVFGALLFFPIPALRNIPINCAEGLSNLMEKSKAIGLGYIAIVFFVSPLLIFIIAR